VLTHIEQKNHTEIFLQCVRQILGCMCRSAQKSKPIWVNAYDSFS
jgi:hypothetical protein